MPACRALSGSHAANQNFKSHDCTDRRTLGKPDPRQRRQSHGTSCKHACGQFEQGSARKGSCLQDATCTRPLKQATGNLKTEPFPSVQNDDSRGELRAPDLFLQPSNLCFSFPHSFRWPWHIDIALDVARHSMRHEACIRYSNYPPMFGCRYACVCVCICLCECMCASQRRCSCTGTCR